MAVKQPLTINFSQGLDTKTDPKQVPNGKFLSLQNTVFDTGGLLQKRNGYSTLTSLPNTSFSYLTTLSGNLTAIGRSIASYNSGSTAWISKGSISPLSLATLPLIRNNANQTQCDSVVAPNNLICTVYTEYNGSTTLHKYAIADSVTGQNVVSPTTLASTGTITGSARVFLVEGYFVILFTNVVSSTPHLQYISISSSDLTKITAPQDIATAYTSATTVSWDAVSFNNNLFVAYNTLSGGQAVKVTALNISNIILGTSGLSPLVFSGKKATMMSLTADVANAVIWISFYDSASSTGFSTAIYSNLAIAVNPIQTITAETVLNITSVAQNNVCTIFYEVSNAYSYDSGIASNYINSNTITRSNTSTTGTLGTEITSIRSVGLASKAFIISGTIYYLSAYNSAFQPTYFLINGTTSRQSAPVIAAKLAYSNGGGYSTLGLPSVTVNNNVAQMSYLYKDLVEALATVNNPQQTKVGGIYAQTGVNQASFTFGTSSIDTAEIANNLHVSGGFLWSFDGYLPVEHNFFVYPDNVEITPSSSGGHLADQTYAYQAVYEWSDNQGNIYRSAASIPQFQANSGGGTSTNTVNIPTLRLTYKTANPVKITLYRWSTGQPIYYQVTSIITPTLNSTTVDSVAFTDTYADATIAGNNIIYTTGGVVEDVNAPASNILTLFDTRLWLVDAEDPNLLWYSKQVIEATPVEMSDLFTYYVAPNAGTVGSTGPIKSLAPMDDKLIIGKANAFYYINGAGPDNTGANNQYSQPIFITGTVGCSNQNSIALIPAGLVFQSDKGIWLLNRNLGTEYIGAAVEAFTTDATVLSADSIPGTNQVRFIMSTGNTLLYDYYFNQWSVFSISGISSCIYNNLHTIINSAGAVYQESPGLYLDGANPVLISFTTSWLNLAGISGYQRFYWFTFLGQYLTPHFLDIKLAYDFGQPVQLTTINPLNYTGYFASDALFAQTSPYAGPTNLEQWKVNSDIQKCQTFQITLNERFNPSYGTVAGSGFTMSGLNCVVGIKKGYRPILGSESAG